MILIDNGSHDKVNTIFARYEAGSGFGLRSGVFGKQEGKVLGDFVRAPPQAESVMYFEKAGIENTDVTLKVAFNHAAAKGIKDVIVASTTGYTAEKILEIPAREAFRIVVVTHNTGFKEEGLQSFPVDLRQRLTGEGISVHTGTMVLRSLGTAIRDLSGGYSEQELVANTLRMFSQGVKVCVEISAMAADAGLVPFADVMAIAGTGRGADTACVIRANSSNRFFKIKVKEFITKPKET